MTWHSSLASASTIGFPVEAVKAGRAKILSKISPSKFSNRPDSANHVAGDAGTELNWHPG